MGVDLTIALPVADSMTLATIESQGFLAYTRMKLCREAQLFERIRALPSKPMLVPVQWYGDDGIEHQTEDPLGDPLMYVFAKDLGSLADCHHVFYYHCDYRYNDAVLKFVRMINPQTIIVLYWD